MDGNPEPITTGYCNTCLQETRHSVLASHEKKDEDPHYHVVFIFTHQMLQCCGCQSISFCLREFCSEAVGPGDPGESVTRYPPATRRREPRWAEKLPPLFRNLLREVYVAIAADARTLTAMGIRSIIDQVGTEKAGDASDFKKKLRGLLQAEYITAEQFHVLDAAFDAGSAAMHRGYHPTMSDLQSLLDIIEHLLLGAYVLRPVAEDLRTRTPPRPKPN